MNPLNSWRALVIDVDPASRRQLLTMLRQFDCIEVVGEAASIREAVKLVEELKPNLVFQEVYLPDGIGFDFISGLPYAPFAIFVTSYEHFAVKAFEIGAVDYLIKPVNQERLALAISRLKTGRGEVLLPPESQTTGSEVDFTTIPASRGQVVVPTHDISCLRSDSNYSQVTLVDGRQFYVYRSLTDWQKRLPPNFFLRLDRSVIIAPSHLENTRTTSRDIMLVSVKGLPEPFKIGRTAQLCLKKHLQGYMR